MQHKPGYKNVKQKKTVDIIRKRSYSGILQNVRLPVGEDADVKDG